MRIVLRIKDWDETFENSLTRRREQINSFCVPNKQDGMAFSRILSKENGVQAYGLFMLLASLCSKHRRPREGWLTDDGTSSGTPWSPSDIGRRYGLSQETVVSLLDVLEEWVVPIDVDNLAEAEPEPIIPDGGAASPAQEITFPAPLDCDEFKTKWSEYTAYRQARKIKPLLPISQNHQIKMLAGWGKAAAIESIDQTIRAGWMGLFAPKSVPAAQAIKPKSAESMLFRFATPK